HHSFELNIKPKTPIPFDLRNKIAMVYSDGSDDEDGKAATYTTQGWYKAPVRNFGTYWLGAGNTARFLSPLQKNGAELTKTGEVTFVARDATTSVKKYRGELDGHWVCFEQHDDLFFYKFDEHCPKGKHEITFSATDENNNTKTIHYTFTR